MMQSVVTGVSHKNCDRMEFLNMHILSQAPVDKIICKDSNYHALYWRDSSVIMEEIKNLVYSSKCSTIIIAFGTQ